jgi:transcriptional regulator with XRE-family HTH domain
MTTRRHRPDSRLLQECERKGLERQDLAAILGVSDSAISRWVWDNREPRRATRARLEKLFGLTWNELCAPGLTWNELHAQAIEERDDA